jgi:hypothetical protein
MAAWFFLPLAVAKYSKAIQRLGRFKYLTMLRFKVKVGVVMGLIYRQECSVAKGKT